MIDYRAVVIDLSATPLTSVNRLDLAQNIRDIHGTAFQWNPAPLVSEAWLKTLVAAYESRVAEQGGLRPLCRAIAKALELAQQHPDHFAMLDPKTLMAAAFQQESHS